MTSVSQPDLAAETARLAVSEVLPTPPLPLAIDSAWFNTVVPLSGPCSPVQFPTEHTWPRADVRGLRIVRRPFAIRKDFALSVVGRLQLSLRENRPSALMFAKRRLQCLCPGRSADG